MLPKIGFSLQSQYDRPMAQVIALLQKAGFSAVSPVWTPELDLSAIHTCVRAHGMTIQSLHAPPREISLLWQPDARLSDALLGTMLHCVDLCSRFQIPTLVVHGWQGLIYTFPTEPLYFQNFDQIVAYAQAQGVSIAFENLEGEEYLSALLQRYHREPNVGFCWDSGHDHCYPHKLDFLKEFGDRLIMTHLNDNLGLRDPAGFPAAKDDLHYLPYDGNIDWDLQTHRLKQARRQETLNFEIKIMPRSSDDDRYTHTPLEQFLAEAGNRARLIAEKYAEIQ